MEHNKSPFEEIFKKEQSRKKEEEKEEEKGILDALDNEEKSLFEGSSDSGSLSLEEKGNVSAEKRYIKLLNELVEKKYYEEAIRVIGEMKAEFGK
jgi:hemerythrin superfamily protein